MKWKVLFSVGMVAILMATMTTGSQAQDISGVVSIVVSGTSAKVEITNANVTIFGSNSTLRVLSESGIQSFTPGEYFWAALPAAQATQLEGDSFGSFTVYGRAYLHLTSSQCEVRDSVGEMLLDYGGVKVNVTSKGTPFEPVNDGRYYLPAGDYTVHAQLLAFYVPDDSYQQVENFTIKGVPCSN